MIHSDQKNLTSFPVITAIFFSDVFNKLEWLHVKNIITYRYCNPILVRNI